MSEVTESVLAELRERVRGEVLGGEEARYQASFDNTRISVMPGVVVRPADEEAVREVLLLANRERIPVTVRGAGSATTGAAAPTAGGIALDLSGWRNLSIDPLAGMAYVQPGVVVAELQRAAEEQGWFYPPDPASLKFCTIGGNIATNAGGLRGAKYGVTRDYVFALEGFLPTGEWVRWGMDLKKFASGYNMRDLWIGSEGQLGVVTGAVLKLVPKPESRWTCLGAYVDEAAALEAVEGLLSLRVVPSILEFIDRQSVECLERARGEPVFPGQANRALLLVELDGDAASLAGQRAKVSEWAEASSLVWRPAENAEEADRLWSVRRECSRAMFQMGDTKLNEDVVVPIRSYRPLLEYTLKLKEETGLATPTFGHAADGNLHVHIMFNQSNEAQTRKAEEAVDKLMRKVVELGGAITGEHGIGLAKSPYLSLQHSPAEIAAMRAIKRALDPNNILNPDKVFTPYHVLRKPREKVRLPWDH